MQVLVNTLANSKTFQKFAIRSNAMLTDVAKKTVDGQKDIHQQSKEFLKVFREEVSLSILISLSLAPWSSVARHRRAICAPPQRVSH